MLPTSGSARIAQHSVSTAFFYGNVVSAEHRLVSCLNRQFSFLFKIILGKE